MNKDPLHNIKDEIDREVFKNTDPVSQKRAILTKIRSEKQKKSSVKSIFINIGVPLCIIMILSILGSSYLFKEDLVKENDKEEPAELTYVPTDEWDEKIIDEKAWIRKSATPDDDVKENLEEETEAEAEKVPEKKEEEEKNEQVEAPPLPAFDFSTILKNPEDFKEKAANGTFVGTSFTIGDSMESIQDMYKDKYQNLDTYDRVEDYLLYIQDEKALWGIRSNISPSYTLDQVIATLGEPYYSLNALQGVYSANYLYGDYIVQMNLQGNNKIKPYTMEEIQFIDRESIITSVALFKNDGRTDSLSKDVKYLGEEEPMVFRTEWFNEARDYIVENTVSPAVVLHSQQDPLEFNIVVPQETPEDEMRAIANQFLKRLTDVSNDAIEEGSIWNDYTYVIHIENSIAGYYDTGLSNSKRTHEGGYPEINWMGDLNSIE
ncbi:hypothetical protein LCD52_22955 [Rossellomorea vietnamensis]|uniref:hypothetical protein n=1 Tax=Rossellomorea vietnamensis TaxID=218284 RepID=UPI001CCD9029|nr:hypothetical protein [Rossellomorea vietnamensis]MCA0151569.1 hypothetical protein [Rossellomorea vietnamensis]